MKVRRYVIRKDGGMFPDDIDILDVDREGPSLFMTYRNTEDQCLINWADIDYGSDYGDYI